MTGPFLEKMKKLIVVSIEITTIIALKPAIGSAEVRAVVVAAICLKN